MTDLRVARPWFRRSRTDAITTLITEPHVHPLLRCNIWHVRGHQRDLLVDTGLGVTSLATEGHDLSRTCSTSDGCRLRRPRAEWACRGNGVGVASETRRADRLVTAGWLFAAGSAVHIVDHLRRGQGSIPDELYWLGNAALVLQVVVVTLVVTRHPRAPLVAAAGGFPLALGFLVVHWLPAWSPISDPVWEVDSLAWASSVASTAEIAGAVLVGFAGLSVLRVRPDPAMASHDAAR